MQNIKRKEIKIEEIFYIMIGINKEGKFYFACFMLSKYVKQCMCEYAALGVYLSNI